MNAIGENMSKPALLNEPARIAALREVASQRKQKEEEKQISRVRREANKQARAQQQADRAKEEERAKQEAPIADVLFALGYTSEKSCKPTKPQMVSFMKANKLSCKKPHPSRAFLVSVLLTRLAAAPPSGGWRRQAAHEVSVNAVSESKADSNDEDSSDESDTEDELADVGRGSRVESVESEEREVAVGNDKEKSEQHDVLARRRRLTRPRSFYGAMVASADTIMADAGPKTP